MNTWRNIDIDDEEDDEFDDMFDDFNCSDCRDSLLIDCESCDGTGYIVYNRKGDSKRCDDCVDICGKRTCPHC